MSDFANQPTEEEVATEAAQATEATEATEATQVEADTFTTPVEEGDAVDANQNTTDTEGNDFEISLPDLSYDQFEKVKEAAIAKQRELRGKERDADLQVVKGLVAKHDLKWADIKPGKPRSKVAPKYRDPETGTTWTGRGKAPLWIRDHADRTPFLIND